MRKKTIGIILCGCLLISIVIILMVTQSVATSDLKICCNGQAITWDQMPIQNARVKIYFKTQWSKEPQAYLKDAVWDSHKQSYLVNPATIDFLHHNVPNCQVITVRGGLFGWGSLKSVRASEPYHPAKLVMVSNVKRRPST